MDNEDLRAINRRVIDEFRAGGEVEGFDRKSLILLTTAGIRTARPHTTPLNIAAQHGDRVLVVAANVGRRNHPAWYLNILANDRVTVETDGEIYEGVATELPADERKRVWPEIEVNNPFNAEAQANVERTIPVVAISRLEQQ